MLRDTFLRALIAATVALALPFAAQAAGKEKKKKKGETAPATEASVPPAKVVVQAPPPPPRPANGSLYTDEAVGNGLFVDFKPRRVGDLVFVDVVETSTASVSSNAKRNRDSGALGGLVGAIGALPVPGAAIVGGVAGGLGTRKYDGSGSTGRTTDLHARIAARVIEVLPNGDLRIEARKLVKINKEDEELAVAGIVRQRDVSSENAVPTTSVGDLRVELNGKGVASADNAPGWLSRLFDKISPF